MYLGSAAVLTGMYTWKIEPFWLEFVNLKMPIKNLPKELVGKKLMQISDMHVGDRSNTKYLIESLKKAQELNPDFVVYTGDYVSYYNSNQLSTLKKVMAHATKGSIGTFGILGNHDYGENWAQENAANGICKALQYAGITMLRNQQRKIAGLNIVGLDDLWGPFFNPREIMPNVNMQAANLVLCHNPDALDLDVWNGYDGWVLSGHTHGGQCKPPFLPPPLLPVKNRKYTAGIFDFPDGRTLYINRALGYLWQVRFNVRPEITVFELVEA
ncbi:MAG: putative MPP superfamily phosphohydrolase [Patiriisocius sp.]|jgi:predicted MPP superfamily phosphohydrolase